MEILKILAVNAVIFIALVGDFFCIRDMSQGRSPTLSTWLMFLVATSLSASSYLATKKDFISGVLILGDTINCIVVVSAILYFSGFKLKFRPFEKCCLAVGVFIGIFWYLSGDALLTNLMVQVLISVGYAPTFYNLIVLRKNTESFSLWIMGLTTSLVSFVFVRGNFLATVYSSRSACLTAVILFLMVKGGKRRKTQVEDRRW